MHLLVSGFHVEVCVSLVFSMLRPDHSARRDSTQLNCHSTQLAVELSRVGRVIILSRAL